MSDSNWGKGVINGIGWGQLATNDIGAGSIYSVSHSGETALIGVSAAFSYSASTFSQDDADPTPTITGNTGGTFSGTSGLVFVSTSTGEIDLSASSVASHVVTYTVNGVSADFSLSVTAPAFSNQFSFEFDGFDEFFTTSISTGTNDVSISYWMKTSATHSNNVSQCAFGGTDNTFGTSYSLGRLGSSFSSQNDTKVRIFNTLGTTKLNDGDWHHVVFTYNFTTKEVKAYVDGTLDLTVTVSLFRSKTIFIGSAGNALFFEGLVDECSLFYSVLSQTDVNTIYGSETPSDISSLNPVAWYRMGDEATFNSGTGVWTLTDQGSGGNNATSNNMEEADRKADTP